jgi:hypothetical protein
MEPESFAPPLKPAGAVSTLTMVVPLAGEQQEVFT